MSNFSSPEIPLPDIVAALAGVGIADANLKPEDLANPSTDTVFSIFSNFLALINPLGQDDSEEQIGFEALELLDNPDHYSEAIRFLFLFRKIRDFLVSIRFNGFTLRDLLKPEPRRTSYVLSALVNFLYYREEKLNLLKPIVSEFPNSEERRLEMKEKCAKLSKAILDYELSAQMEEPIVQQVDAEVKELRQSIQNFNKQQMTLKTQFKALKDKKEAINAKISQADFELVKHAQENSNLLSRIVQSPEKLQRALEEKRATCAEVKKSEKLAIQSVQEKSDKFEIYSKACEKLNKHIARMQAIQEQVNAAKGIEKEVKTLKAKISDEDVSIMSTEAKIVEKQGKAKQAEELLKIIEKERDTRFADETQRLNAVRSEIAQKLKDLESRECNVKDMVAEGDNLCAEAIVVKAAGKEKQEGLLAKLEEVVRAYRYYADTMSPFLKIVEEFDKDALATAPIDKCIET